MYKIKFMAVALLCSILMSCSSGEGKVTDQEMEPEMQLTSWEDSLAYALGMNYAREKSFGYSKSLDEYLSDRRAHTPGLENDSELFTVIARRGADDVAKRATLLTMESASTFLNLVDCENRILNYENQIKQESDDKKAFGLLQGMIGEFKRMWFILQNHPEISYLPRRIENYAQKRQLILDNYSETKDSETKAESMPEPPAMSVGRWQLKSGEYVSPLFNDELKRCTVSFVLAKGKMLIKFSEPIEREFQMNIIRQGRETAISGTRSGNTFVVSASSRHDVFMAMEDGSFTLQYLLLEPGASHWGWYEFDINGLTQATQAFNAINR